MSNHESFEQLCALAVTGELTPEEFRQLQDHLLECASCRETYKDFHTLLGEGLPTLEPATKAGWSFATLSLKRRFLRRVKNEGIAIERPAWRGTYPWTSTILAAALTGVLVIGLEYRLRHAGPSGAEIRVVHRADGDTSLSARINHLEARIAALSRPQPVAKEPPARGQTAELNRIRREYESALAGKAELLGHVQQLKVELEEMNRDREEARAQLRRLQDSLNMRHVSLAKANRELETLRELRSSDALALSDQSRRIEQLSAKIHEQSDILDRERQLMAAGRDIRDLMGARNLRIVDVEDTGAGGSRNSVPGRIFYTQGKSLIFYAYDLHKKGNIGRVAFQAWGKKEGRAQSARSLGVFYTDDAAEKRWVLKFENPEVLAQIDQVFVTVEPAGGSKQPTNRPFLTAAFLNDAANHP